MPELLSVGVHSTLVSRLNFISTRCFYDERNNVHRPVPKHYVEKLVQPLSEKHLRPMFCVYLDFQSLTILDSRVTSSAAGFWESLVGAREFSSA